MTSHTAPRFLRRFLRLQRRSPGTTAMIVLTVAVAIAACVAVFSVVDPLLLRPLPFPRGAELDVISSAFPRMQLASLGLSGPEALEFSELTHAYSAVGVLAFDTATVATDAEPVRAAVARASASAFEVLQLVPAAGRFYGEAEDRPGGAAAVVLGYEFWQRAFGGERTTIGRAIRVDGAPAAVVGVMPRASLLNRAIDIWVPLALAKQTAGGRADHRYTVIARRRPDVAAAAALADVNAAVARWQDATGELHSPAAGFHPLVVQSLAEATSGSLERALWTLAAAVALVMLIACANVAHLLLGRVDERRADVATQIALGASRRALIGLYGGEAVTLAGIGASIGIGLAAFAVSGLKAFGPALVRPEEIEINGRVLVFGTGACLLVAALIAMAPVAAIGTGRAFAWLQSAGRGGTARGRGRVQRGLVAFQLAVAVALSAAAILTVRSLITLTRIDPGFQTEHVLRVQVSLPATGYEQDARTFDFFDGALDRIRQLPGVRETGAMSGVPPLRPANNTTFSVDTAAAVLDHRNVPQVEYVQHATPGYFEAMGIPLREGRVFTGQDVDAAAPVAIVNETLARRFWPGRSAVGHRLRPAGLTSPWFTVVGVVGDVRQGGLQMPAGAEFYVPYRQAHRLFDSWVPHTMNLVVLTKTSPANLAPSVREIVHALEPSAAVSAVSAMEDVVAGSIARPRC